MIDSNGCRSKVLGLIYFNLKRASKTKTIKLNKHKIEGISNIDFAM